MEKRELRCVVETRANQLGKEGGYSEKLCPFFGIACLGIGRKGVEEIGFEEAVNQCSWVEQNMKKQAKVTIYLAQGKPPNVPTGMERFIRRLEKTAEIKGFTF